MNSRPSRQFLQSTLPQVQRAPIEAGDIPPRKYLATQLRSRALGEVHGDRLTQIGFQVFHSHQNLRQLLRSPLGVLQIHPVRNWHLSSKQVLGDVMFAH